MHYNCNLFIVEVLHYYCRNSLCTIIASYLLKYCTIIAVFFLMFVSVHITIVLN